MTASSARHVQVYGNDHSPWVQAVLLGLHEKGISYDLLTAPPLSVFRRSGVLMPAARIDDGDWTLDSERILVRLGFSEVDPEIRRALQAFFLSSALARTDDAFAFWRRFSWSRDGTPGLARPWWSHFVRAFPVLYFFVLIRMNRGRVARPDRDRLVAELGFFQDCLGDGAPFLGGGEPDTADLQLFGLVQMCASIPGRALAVLRDAPELESLRAWVERMQGRFAAYPHLYSATDFDPRQPAIAQSTPLERLVYWCGAAFMWIAAPLTVPLALYYAQRIRRLGLAP